VALPLICVNGVVPAGLTFAALAAEFHGQRPVVLHDLVGYAQPRPEPYDLGAELTALGALPAPTHLFGYSAGASVALAFALHAPERIATLTLFEPPWVGLAPVGWFEREMDRVLLDVPAALRWERFHHLLTRPGVAVPPLPSDPPPWVAARARQGADVWRALRATTLDPARLRAFHTPVLLALADGSHPFFAESAGRLAGLLPTVRVERFPGNHVQAPHVVAAPRFAAALRRLFSLSALDHRRADEP
jgi:pimeloyl-ACP methyl ester carboxylesterase